MKKLKLTDISFGIIAHDEHLPIIGNAISSGDIEFDKKVENKIIEEVQKGNEWAWCNVEVYGDYNGIFASAHLGCCSYENKEEFINGGYYDSMREDILKDIQSKLRDISEEEDKTILEALIAAKKSLEAFIPSHSDFANNEDRVALNLVDAALELI